MPIWINRSEAVFISAKEDLMRTHHQRWILPGVLAILLCIGDVSLAVRAQDAQVTPDSQTQDSQPADDQDPPGRVARLNYIDGSVTFQPGGENDWVDAALNRPLMGGDNLWADQDSRAELHIGSTALRLGPMTGITLLEVSEHATQIRLVQGSLIVKVRHVDDNDLYEVDTPNVAFVVMQPGDYRIDVDSEGARTDVIVWRGRGEVTGGGSSYTVAADQHATFTGTDQLNYDLAQIPGNDGFDTWALDRDRAEDESDSANYVSRETTGYEDLDQYGDWTYVAGYGPCWRPRLLVAGWAPYRFGHWAWVGPWGWTWVGDEPWAFAPFHYGRWAFAGTNWVWVPGPAAVRPVYAPAQVGWIGGGAGARFSFGAGVGWFPLAPGEVFIPYYRVSRAYVNRVNLTGTHVEMTRISSVYNSVTGPSAAMNDISYANRNVAGGVTVVSHDTFVGAQPVARNIVSVSPKELAAAPTARRIEFEPVRASVIGAEKPATAKPPVAVMSRQVVALRVPAPMPRSFDRQPQAGPRPTSTQLVRQQSRGVPVEPLAMPNRSARVAQTDDGFRSVTATSSGNNATKTQPVVWEAQGDPDPPRESQSQQQHAHPAAESNNPRQNQQSSQQSSHSLSKVAAPPVQKRNDQPQEEKYSSWHQQKSSSGSSKIQSSTAKPSSTPAK
jgi:FecR protein